MAVAYLAGAWLLVEVSETLFSIYGFPESALRIVVTLLVIGFPITLVLSWVYELTPEGLKLEKDIDRAVPSTRSGTRPLDRAIIVLLALALGYLAVDKFVFEPGRLADWTMSATSRVSRPRSPSSRPTWRNNSRMSVKCNAAARCRRSKS